MIVHPIMIEILKSEHHRCKVNLSASKLQLNIAKEQLKRSEDRVKIAQERLSAIRDFCNYLGIEEDKP